MCIFTFHLVKTNYRTAFKALWNPLRTDKVPGLVHVEWMTGMTLGSPIISTSRILLRQAAVFAQWENEAALDHFLQNNPWGKILSRGWHTRLLFLRQWGSIQGFQIPGETRTLEDPNSPVVAVTLARMQFLQVPRFIHWGRPVEKLVRDHPGTTLALAATRLPRTVSTFSIWKSEQEMVDMVRGHSAVPQPKRHADAMKERNRKGFHIEFSTLRFQPIGEYGQWEGRSHFIPNLNSEP